ncbi:MAG: shikimate kinase [Phycisphaerae bacterium]|nr:shikimate kinase [Phycisphaerae bacterium]
MAQAKSNIVLIGMPGSGKSTIGVLLAKRLGRYFLDTDVLIQVAHEKSLHELIAEGGMEAFCRIEQDYVTCIDIKNAVIATGGSVVYYESSMRSLQNDGILVYLQLPLENLKKRLGDLDTRGVVIDPGQTLEGLYEKRTPLYEQWAEVTVNLSGLGHEASVEAILKKLDEIK